MLAGDDFGWMESGCKVSRTLERRDRVCPGIYPKLVEIRRLNKRYVIIGLIRTHPSGAARRLGGGEELRRVVRIYL